MITRAYNYCRPKRRCNGDRPGFLATLLACKTVAQGSLDHPLRSRQAGAGCSAARPTRQNPQHRRRSRPLASRVLLPQGVPHPSGYILVLVRFAGTCTSACNGYETAVFLYASMSLIILLLNRKHNSDMINGGLQINSPHIRYWRLSTSLSRLHTTTMAFMRLVLTMFCYRYSVMYIGHQRALALYGWPGIGDDARIVLRDLIVIFKWQPK